MVETILQNKSLVTPMQTAISLIRVKQNGSRDKVPICRSNQADLYYAIFDEDDCDFEISIDNTQCEDRQVRVRLGFHNKKYGFLWNKRSAGTLQTYKSNGGKFHFVRESSEDGKTLIAKATHAHGLSWKQASEMMSQMKFEVEYSDSPAFSIFFRDLDGSTKSLDVFEGDTIRAVKKMIEVKEGIAVDDQRLSFGGKLLRDDQKLKDCRIRKLSTLDMGLKLLGGDIPQDHDKQSNSDVGERGVICLGEKSEEVFIPASIDIDRSVRKQSFTIEMRLTSKYTIL